MSGCDDFRKPNTRSLIALHLSRAAKIGAQPGAAKRASRNGMVSWIFFNPGYSAAAVESPHTNKSGFSPCSMQFASNPGPGASQKHLSRKTAMFFVAKH